MQNTFRVGLVSLALPGVSLLGSFQAHADSKGPVAYTESGHAYRRGEFLVKAKSEASLERARDFLSKNLATDVLSSRKMFMKNADGSGWYKMTVSANTDVPFAISSLRGNGIEYAEPNYLQYANEMEAATLKPQAARKKDPYLSKLYGLNNIKVQDAWKITEGSRKVVVAVIDSGADYTHPDLLANTWVNRQELVGDEIDNDKNGYVDDLIGWNFKDNTPRPYDEVGHGTHCFGTIAAVGNNGKGISGVAKYAQVMPLKFLGGPEGSGTTEDAILAIQYALKNGAQILSNSWGGGPFSQALFDAVKDSEKQGALFVVAAGNENSNNDTVESYPSNYKLSNVLAVAATDSKDILADFSNFGVKTVHLAAPGVDILSTFPGKQYGYLSGTSMATPHVAGAAALLKSAYPKLTGQEIKSLLFYSVDRLPNLTNAVWSGGRLNVAAALELARKHYGEPSR